MEKGTIKSHQTPEVFVRWSMMFMTEISSVLHLLGFTFICFLHTDFLYVAYFNRFQIIQFFSLLYPLQVVSHYSWGCTYIVTTCWLLVDCHQHLQSGTSDKPFNFCSRVLDYLTHLLLWTKTKMKKLLTIVASLLDNWYHG